MSLAEIHENLRRSEIMDIAADAESMKVFADGDDTFILGEWRQWRTRCQIEGRVLPPSEFKKTGKRVSAPDHGSTG